MKKNFSANLLFLLFLNLLIKPVYVFGIDVGIQNEVGAEEYGLYYAMFNFTFLFNVLLDMGINNFQKIKVAENEMLGLSNMKVLVPLKLILALVYFVVTIIVAALLGFEGRYWFFIGWLMVNHVLSAFLLLLRANLSGLHLFFRDSIVSVIDRLLLVIVIGYLLWYGSMEFRIEYLVLLQTAAYFIAIVSAYAMTPSGSRFFSLNLSMASMRKMITNTWPYALLILLMTAYNKLDGVMLERLAPDGLRQAGVYAQAYRIIDAGNSFAFLYAGMLLPMFSRLLREKNARDLRVIIDQGARFLIIPAGLATVISYFHGHWFMDLLYTQDVDESSLAFTWLMGSFFFICIGYVFGTLLTASQNLSLLNWIAFIAVAINFSLNMMLIPAYGAEGAAIASFSSLSVMAGAQFVVTMKQGLIKSSSWIMRGAACWLIAIGVGSIIADKTWGEAQQLLVLGLVALLSYVIIGLKRADLKMAKQSQAQDNK